LTSHSQSHIHNGFFKLVGALLQVHSCFFSHSIKQRGIPLSAVTVSMHFTCQDVCVQRSHAEKRLLLLRNKD